MTVALLAEGVDRNLVALARAHNIAPSPSSRRAWIEIDTSRYASFAKTVALLAEGVDRNSSCLPYPQRGPVALLAEGVDRNNTSGSRERSALKSPSSRRAWIEILKAYPKEQ